MNEELEEKLAAIAREAQRHFQSGIISVIPPDGGGALVTAFGNGHYVASAAVAAMTAVQHGGIEGEEDREVWAP